MAEIERLGAEGDGGTLDELLERGGSLLNAGKLNEACEVLEKANQLAPKDSKAQNFLGLTYFKLGVFDRASELYETLVRDNPVDPTLRVNLGLVYLKLNALARATREFETAVDLAPDHKKAQNYLGLAYAQAGEYAKAKDCFVAAGSLTMAEKMERALKEPAKGRAGEVPAPPPPEPAAQASPPPEPHEPPKEVEIQVEAVSAAPQAEEGVAAEPSEATEAAGEVPVSAWEGGEGGESPVEVVAAPAPVAEQAEAPQPAPAEAPAPALAPVPLVVPAPGSAAGPLPLLPLMRSLVPPPPAASPFDVQPETLVVRVQGEMLTRLEGLLAVSGAVQYLPEMKRFRGKATDKAFGDGERRMVRLSGTASVTLAARGKVFVPIDLADESAYFLEETVFAFEETVVFENGRVPSRIAPDLHLVHLRGKGRVLLAIPSPLRAVAVTPEAACAVPMVALVGWSGSLTPKIVGLPEERDGVATLPSVELTGEGYALTSAPKPPPQV